MNFLIYCYLDFFRTLLSEYLVQYEAIYVYAAPHFVLEALLATADINTSAKNLIFCIH